MQSPANWAGLYVILDMSPFASSPLDLDVGARTRPSDLDTRFAHAAALLDGHAAVTHPSADSNVAVAVHAVLAAQRSDASSLQIRSALAGSESAPDAAIVSAMARI